MKKTGDYYVVVVEDTNVGQIVATAMLIVEHKFIHACAKVQYTFYHAHVGTLLIPTSMIGTIDYVAQRERERER